jgi:hypothetical protein
MGVVGLRPMEQLETQFGLAQYPKVASAAAIELPAGEGAPQA